MPHYLPESISTFGADIDGVMRFIYVVGGAWFVAAEALLFWLLFRYRRAANPRAAWLPADTWRTNAWVLVPAALVLGTDLAIEVVATPVWAQVKEEVPAHDVLVRVTARQFTWLYTYAGTDGVLDTADDFGAPGLRVPVGRVVRMQLESEDVLHAFWSPELRLKQDIIPGRSIPAWFSATKAGSYDLACAELCGRSHSWMKSTIQVETPEAWDAWARSQR